MRENTITCTTALVCALVGSTLGAKPATAQTQTDKFAGTIERLKRSVAPVVCVDVVMKQTTADIAWVAGTAVFVEKDGTFVTANHVIDDVVRAKLKDGRPCQYFAVCVPANGWTWVGRITLRYIYFAISRCKRDAKQDLAVCEPLFSARQTTGADVEPAAIETAVLPEGTVVTITGFPFGSRRPFSSRATVAGYDEIEEGLPGKLILDKNSWLGSSGGPVYTQDGKVIGIVLETTNGGPGLIGATIVRTGACVRRFLSDDQRPKTAP